MTPRSRKGRTVQTTQPGRRKTDSAVVRARGRLGAARRDGNQEMANEAMLDMREAVLAQRIKELADAMPPLSPERRARLAALLQPTASA